MGSFTYALKDGVYIFPTELEVELRLKNVQRDKFGRLHADARFVTNNGAVLALAHGDLMSGSWRRDFAQQVAARNSGDPIRWENVVIEAIVALESDKNVTSQAAPATAPRLVTARQYLAAIPTARPEIVEGIGGLGDLLAVVAKPKTAKSLLTLGLAVTVAGGGGVWLGRRAASGRAAVFQLEDSPRTVGRRLRAMIPGAPSDDLLLHLSDGPFRISDENYGLVADACRGCSLVVVDPIIQASQVVDWNAQNQVRNAWDFWRRLARDVNALVLIVAHHRKALGEFGEQIAGSVQGLATPDGVIEIRRDPNLLPHQRRVSYVGRDWPDIEDEVIALDPVSLTFSLVGTAQAFSNEREQRKNEGHAATLIDLIPVGPPGLNHEELILASDLGDKPVRAGVRHLLAEGQIEMTGRPRSKKDPVRYHRPGPGGPQIQKPSSSSADPIYSSAEDEDQGTHKTGPAKTSSADLSAGCGQLVQTGPQKVYLPGGGARHDSCLPSAQPEMPGVPAAPMEH